MVLTGLQIDEVSPSKDERAALAVLGQGRSPQHIVPDSEVRKQRKLNALLTTGMQDEEAPHDVQYRQKTPFNQPPAPSAINTNQRRPSADGAAARCNAQYREKVRSNHRQPPVPSSANRHVIQDDNQEALVSN